MKLSSTSCWKLAKMNTEEERMWVEDSLPPGGGLTLPRFYRHLHKGENGEIGGAYVSRNSTAVYRGL